MFYAMVTATFQYVRERHEIAVNVRVGICQRIPYACLGRKVDDALRADTSEQFRRTLTIREIQLLEMESWSLKKLCQPILFQGRVVVVVQVVHAEDFVAFVQKALRYVEADETSGACY
jgi:hypothetical protein